VPKGRKPVKFSLKILMFCVFVPLWFMVSLPAAYAAGRQDQALARADELIHEKRYDDAIVILSGFSRRNPVYFDQAQRRLRQIYRARDEFNRVGEELVDTLLNEPENSEKILDLTRHLEELESSTSPLFISFITRVRELALYNFNRMRLQDILVRARAQLDHGDFHGALLTYAGGMDIYRDEFFNEGYGEIIENQVRRQTENINAVLGAFSQAGALLRMAASEMVQVVESGQAASLAAVYSRMLPVMDSFIELQQDLYNAAGYFDYQLDIFQNADPSIGNRNHLAFMIRLIHGRPGESIQEGMLGALEGHWNSTAGRIENAITEKAENNYSNGMAAFRGNNYITTRNTLAGTDDYTRFSGLLFGKRMQLKEGGNPRSERIFDQQILPENAGQFLRLESINGAGVHLAEAADLGSRLVPLRSSNISLFADWQSGAVNSGRAMEQEQQSRTGFDGLQNDLNGVLAAVEQRETELRLYENIAEESGDADYLFYIEDTKSAIENLYSIIVEEVLRSARRYYTIGNGDLYQSLTARREELAEANVFIQGQRRETEDGNVVIGFYPAEGLAILGRMLQALEDDIGRGNNLLTLFRNEQPVILADGGITGLQTSAVTTVNELIGLRTQGLAVSNAARNRISQAEAYRQEGERLFREAQAAYTRQALETAREQLQRAADRFNDSLAIQESASLRADWDNRLVNLGQDISRLENEMVIRDVRNLVNNARDTYFAGNFERAEDYLLRARSRWQVTNIDENEEVIYWLGIVRGALSLRSGRVILPTAPLYPEMSQLLSEAKRNYEEGVRYINIGQRSNGLAKFSEARQQTREVKLIFPVNQEAGILELRMDQFIDPAAFNASFEQRLRDAVAGTRRRSLESFADLQNLAEINPRYPGIAGILRQAEIDMGYRLPPPNPQNLARSRELAASASRILEGNISTQYEVAVAQINEAIALNPENIEATLVKDRLLTRMSAPGAIVLNSQDESNYQRAVRELQSGNNLMAMAIVERLLQNPNNRNVIKLIELQRRIQSVL